MNSEKDISQILNEQGLQPDAVFMTVLTKVYHLGRLHGSCQFKEKAVQACETAELLFDIEMWLNSTKKEMTAHTAVALAEVIRAIECKPENLIGVTKK